MSDLQCRKLHFGSQQLRILGKVNTSIQCITNGMVAGNLHFKASVVESLYESFHSHSIAGNKLRHVLSSPISSVTLEPQTPPKPAKKRKRRDKLDTSPTSSTTSPSLSSGSVSTMPECEKRAAAAHAEAIKAAIAANTKLPPRIPPQHVPRRSHPGYVPLEPRVRRSPLQYVPQEPPPRRSPPGFPQPRFGRTYYDCIYQGLEYCQ